MKELQRIVWAALLLVVGVESQAAAQFSAADYSLYAGDFNGDGKSDLLYIGRTPDKPNGIALADSAGAPQVGFQSWPATYLGIPWSTGQFKPLIGDFNGDGRSDVLMQAATAGTSYLILANGNSALAPVGQFLGINQGISQTAFGLEWSADKHKLHVGDFDGNGKDDVLLQATNRGGTNAIVLADSGGNLFTQSTGYCWAGGPQQCWTDGEQGFLWSTANSVLHIGKFNADSRSDVLVQGRPDIILIDYEIPIPVPRFRPQSFGIFLGQVADGAGKIVRTANQLWDQTGLNAKWSPIGFNLVVADFNGDGFSDVFLQARSGGAANQIAYGASNGTIGNAGAVAANVAAWSANAYTAIAGKFGNSTRAVLYLQAQTASGTNAYSSDISLGSVSTTTSAPQMVAALPAATTIGATPGNADVSASGSAQYSIPIQLPRGTAGLTPDLALTYSSGSGNGLVGVGWNLSGLGIIARCPKTIAQDGVTLGVELVTADEYCLNGNRLRRVSGTQGAAGSVYRTELETYARVTAVGTGTQGPLSWTVETKDGLIYEYGNSTDSRILVPSSTVTRLWALNKVRDRDFNTWTVSYTTQTGAYYPNQINYTNNSAQATAAPYRVQFYYQARNAGEQVVSYYGGGLINLTQRLQRVELQTSAAVMIRKYTLAYQTPVGSFSTVSRLGSVQECSPSACMAATSFAWSDTQMSGNAPALSGTQTIDPGYGNFGGYGSALHADINGDGIPDSVVLTAIPTQFPPYQICNVVVHIGARAGQTAPAPYGVPNFTCTGLVGVMDLDGDGKEDVLFGGNWLRQNSAGTIVYEAAPGLPSLLFGMLIDVDGDGFRDLVNQGASSNQTTLYVRFHNRDGSAGFEATESVAWTAPAGSTILTASYPWWMNYNGVRTTLTTADVDGDGRQDMLVQMTNGWRVIYANGTGFTTGDLVVPFSNGSGASITYATPIPLDINGDGCTDLAYPKSVSSVMKWHLQTSRCLFSANVGLNAALNTNVNATLNLGNTVGTAVDWNNDGYQDLLNGAVMLLSNGTTLSSYAGWGGVHLENMWIDRNGDGVLDFVTVCTNTSICNVGVQFVRQDGLGDRSNLIVKVTDGFGKTAQYRYATLTDATLYSRGTGTAGKTQDFGAALTVVRSLELSDGAGAVYTQSYSYQNGRRNVQGRGFLGFGGRTVTDSRTGFVTQETFNNTVAADGTEWQFAGTLAARTVRQYAGGPLVEEQTQQWNSIAPDSAANRRYPYVGSAVVKKYELTGTNSPISTATTTTTIDNYGTPYDVTTTVVEGISGVQPGSSAALRRYTPVANILNDTTSWCVARPSRVEEIRSHSLTHGASITRVTEQTWNGPKCRVTNTVVAPGTSWQLNTAIEYDLFNNVNRTTVTGSGIATSIITEANFGTNGHLQQWAENAKDQRTTFTWNVNLGVRLTQTDPNLLQTVWTYDDFGREQRMTRPDGTSTYKTYYNCSSSNSYCGDSLLRYVVRTSERTTADAEINYVDEYFDLMGRVKYQQTLGFDGTKVVVQKLYDNRGNVALTTNPYYANSAGVSGLSQTYDNLNRLVQTRRPYSDTNPSVVTESVSYDGLSTTVIDANGRAQTKVSAVWGGVLRATDEAGKHTNYTYNAFGDLRTVTDPAGNVTTVNYNIRGFKESSVDPNMGTWQYTYDALGQLLTQVDAKAQTTSFTYDVLGRTLTRADHPGGATKTTTWTWDTAPSGFGKGQLSTVAAPGSYSETYAYDNKSRRSQLSTLANGTTYVMNYAYDATTGRPKTFTYPASTGTVRLAAEYAYQRGYIKDVRDASNLALLWQANAQDARGHVTQEQFGNGQISNLVFDQTSGRLNAVQTGAGGGAATQNLSYSWDAVGNLQSRRDNAQSLTETLEYDSLYRLTTVRRNGSITLTMGYNDIGNITSKSDVGTYTYTGAQAGCTYYAHSQPSAVRKVGTSVYCYDANGNMVTRSGASVAWSTFNYPTTINQAGGNTSTFYYGADRNRYRQVSVDAGVTENRVTVGDGAFEKLIRTGGTDPATEYRHFIQVNGKPVAIVKRKATNAAPTVLVSADTHYLHEDHLGSTDVITNAAGAIVVRLSFDAWGKRRGSAWTGDPSAADKTAIKGSTYRGYTGHEQLDNLNLVHMNGRVYDPIIARFVSADPIIQDPFHSQSFNRYAYVWNNPLNATDPTGFEMCTGSRIPRANCNDVVGFASTNYTPPSDPKPPTRVEAERNTSQSSVTIDVEYAPTLMSKGDESLGASDTVRVYIDGEFVAAYSPSTGEAKSAWEDIGVVGVDPELKAFLDAKFGSWTTNMLNEPTARWIRRGTLALT